MSIHTDNAEERMEKSIESLEYNFGRVRTGRANPHILDAIKVDYYGVPTPITQLAGVKVPEVSMPVIEQWDKSSVRSGNHALKRRPLDSPAVPAAHGGAPQGARSRLQATRRGVPHFHS